MWCAVTCTVMGTMLPAVHVACTPPKKFKLDESPQGPPPLRQCAQVDEPPSSLRELGTVSLPCAEACCAHWEPTTTASAAVASLLAILCLRSCGRSVLCR